MAEMSLKVHERTLRYSKQIEVEFFGQASLLAVLPDSNSVRQETTMLCEPISITSGVIKVGCGPDKAALCRCDADGPFEGGGEDICEMLDRG